MDYQELSDQATEYIRARYGRVAMQCAEGSARLVTLARKNGVKLTKVGGLHGYSQHWWCVSPDGVIVDSTAEQFGRSNGVQSVRLGMYEAITRAEVEYLPDRDGYFQDAWFAWKRAQALGAPKYDVRGSSVCETRTSKRGHTYNYKGYRIVFTWSNRSQVRSVVTFDNEKSIVEFINMQRRVFTKDGRIVYPCWQVRRVYDKKRDVWFLSKKDKLVLDDRFS